MGDFSTREYTCEEIDLLVRDRTRTVEDTNISIFNHLRNCEVCLLRCASYPLYTYELEQRCFRLMSPSVEQAALFTRADYEKRGWYPTWDEAAAATRALGITSSAAYLEWPYPADPHLPWRPDIAYCSVWILRGAWLGFLWEDWTAPVFVLPAAMPRSSPANHNRPVRSDPNPFW